MITRDSLLAALPPLTEAALFLDFDGTLVDIAPTPDGIAVPSDLSDLLDRLALATEGAAALVSGRAVEALSEFLPRWDGAVAGGHGAELRIGSRHETHPLAGSAALQAMTAAAERFASARDGLLVEPKPTGVVLHYRRAPHLQSEVEAHMDALARAHPGVELHGAKMAAELRPDDIGKERAVARLMEKPPFAGRRAVFFGDDATDEPAMRFCVDRGGLACKVGDGDSAAPWRLRAPADVRALLADWLARTAT